MAEQAIKKQIAGEYYNVIYGAKLHLASFDICEKLPTLISVTSLSFGVLGLAFNDFNTNALAALLLIIGIVGIILKPRELQKEQYKSIGDSLTHISKKLENTYYKAEMQNEAMVAQARSELIQLQEEHKAVKMMPPVFLSSWYAHYKVFSEHNSDWMSAELSLGWTDKVPLSLRLFVIIILVAALLWATPLCITSKAWSWFSDFCMDDRQKQEVMYETTIIPSENLKTELKRDAEVKAREGTH
ncbi:SLATT domain-containing protein [Pseudoalteromonas sp. US3C1013]|uniref:SLATT domain-containing protein n=1 Tax=unclassified Pseudoalteromonas TaxID=194690 RepID=UPI003AB8A0E5